MPWPLSVFPGPVTLAKFLSSRPRFIFKGLASGNDGNVSAPIRE